MYYPRLLRPASELCEGRVRFAVVGSSIRVWLDVLRLSTSPRRQGGDMLCAQPKSNEMGQETPELRRTIQQTDHEWNAVLTLVQGTAQKPVLHDELKANREARGQTPSLLDSLQLAQRRRPPRLQGGRDQSNGCYRVLNCEVDTNPADGRHGVCGVSDAE